ncbi:MAG: hypothetical protein WAP56_03420 [Acetivibrionales bacterium]|jgi:hypothetical protein|nr:hypothetical protein [Clostridiaceae bacterium]HOA56084.1 hypothetical protein [Clostridiales bacterium]
MKNNITLHSIPFIVAGGLFIIAGIVGKYYYFIPIGCCFIVLGARKKEK